MFTARPPVELVESMPVMRSRPGKPLLCVSLCEEWRGILTHYRGGHTVPCCGTVDCASCHMNQMPRWQGYFVARGVTTPNHGLIQISAGAVPAMDRMMRPNGGLSGVKMLFTRVGSRVNSPVCVTQRGYEDIGDSFPMERLESLLRRLFQNNSLRSNLEILA